MTLFYINLGDTMLDPEILKHPLLQNIPKNKFEFIVALSNRKKPTSSAEAMPFILSCMQDAKRKQISFSKEEILLITQIMIKDLSPQDKEKALKILKLMQITE